MNRLLTTLLVWLLMAALPLHAAAAAASLSCGHAQQHGDDRPAHAHGYAADHDNHVAAGGEHAHHGGPAADGAADPMDAAAAEASAESASESDSILPHASCSACSAFCVGAVAPPSAALALPTFDGSEPVVIAPSDSATGFIPEGLQRPPRP